MVSSGLLVAAGALWFYWGPPAYCAFPALWLGAGYCWLAVAGNASMVSGNTVATELFPTVLRGTMIGWFSLIGAAGSVAAQAAIAMLAQPFGGLSNVVGYLALLGIPSAISLGSSSKKRVACHSKSPPGRSPNAVSKDMLLKMGDVLTVEQAVRRALPRRTCLRRRGHCLRPALPHRLERQPISQTLELPKSAVCDYGWQRKQQKKCNFL